ncbi:MAG: hypothetical protein H7A23_10090 [Leptospiraceae bacterium]|nr:hypothetical protein [Leptospiraceae bacterium]
MEIKRRLTKHTHCGSESNLKFSLPCTEKRLRTSKQVLCLRLIGSYSVTALALAKVPWPGDMPKRHVGYALTLDGISKALTII